MLLVHICVLVYVTVWLAVVFGINSVSNAGRKIVEHYYTFHNCIVSINKTANHTVTD